MPNTRNTARAILISAALIGCSDEIVDGGPPTRPPEVGCAGCIVLTGGTVFDGSTAGLGTVVLDGDRVAEVVFGDVDIVAGEVVDATGNTVMPGLFELHSHTPAAPTPYGYYAEGDLVPDHFKAFLRAGVTTVLDVGSSRRTIFEYRARVREGHMRGPNFLAAGAMLTATGGHPCYAGSPPGDACYFIDSPADVGPVMAELVADEADVVKVIIEAGTLQQPLPQLSPESLAEIAAQAEAAGLKPLAHVGAAGDMTLALDAGIHDFLHVAMFDAIDDDLAERLLAEKAVVVATVAVTDSFNRIAHGEMHELDDPAIGDDVPAVTLAGFEDPQAMAGMTSPEFKEYARELFEQAMDNVAKLIDMGVTLAAGTDAGNPGTFHGLALARELELYVEAGMDPVAALAAGTANAADVVGATDRGRLQPGAVADVLIVEGDATMDITALKRVSRVYQRGQLIDRDELALPVGASMHITQPEDRAQDETCLGQEECGADLYCDFFQACQPICSATVSCAEGSFCYPQAGSQIAGFCYPGDDCDPLAQNCGNGSACIWTGNGATLCWYSSEAVGGEQCTGSGECAPGHQCDLYTNQCKQLCDPSEQPTTCPAMEVCVDKTESAGIPIGECE